MADAAKDKVIVIAYDRMITGSADYDYYITFDNFKVGAFQGKAIEKALNLPKATKAKPKYYYFVFRFTDRQQCKSIL